MTTVSDEIHADMVMPGYAHVPFASLSDEVTRACVACAAPSKTFNTAGLMTSNIIVANDEPRGAGRISQRPGGLLVQRGGLRGV